MPQDRKQQRLQAQVQRHFSPLIGRTITALRALSCEESLRMGLDDAMVGPNPVLAMILDNGSVVIVTSDPEGNGPGWLEVLTPQT